MRRSVLVAGAVALQLAIMLASASPVWQRDREPVGTGFWDVLTCAGCALGGVFLVASGGAADSGSLDGAAAACIDACLSAVE